MFLKYQSHAYKSTPLDEFRYVDERLFVIGPVRKARITQLSQQALAQ